MEHQNIFNFSSGCVCIQDSTFSWLIRVGTLHGGLFFWGHNIIHRFSTRSRLDGVQLMCWNWTECNSWHVLRTLRFNATAKYVHLTYVYTDQQQKWCWQNLLHHQPVNHKLYRATVSPTITPKSLFFWHCEHWICTLPRPLFSSLLADLSDSLHSEWPPVAPPVELNPYLHLVKCVRDYKSSVAHYHENQKE